MKMESSGKAFPDVEHNERDRAMAGAVPHYISSAYDKLPNADAHFRHNDFDQDFKKHVAEMDPIKMSDLLRRTGVSSQGIKGALDRLHRLKEIVLNEGSISYKMGRLFPESGHFGHHQDSYERGKEMAEMQSQPILQQKQALNV